ncbi:hypothetical protein SCHPADRAFT_932913 [Schizopora paradoxa]|uniref:F-box domain-containing protein n=1 Tax=Schizopora paradoxa TaxID=27342 RepID=A0A0H2RB24_9AGAM|nr:hypothetical protein SCHPADRAFT_932913 [Schizopora paradoxa]
MASRGLDEKFYGDDARAFGFELDSWCRLRTKWSRNDLSPEDISQLFRDSKNLDNMVHILKLLHSSASQLQQSVALGSKPMISKLSRGIASLPNEILMHIFGILAPAGGRTSRQQAIWLSHVSRRFRSIALGTRSIWTTLDGCASKDELNTFVSRSGKDSDLHLIFYMWVYDPEPEPEPEPDVPDFVDWCLPLASRWTSFLVLYEDGEIDRNDGLIFSILETVCADRRAYPRLQMMRIQQDPSTANTIFEPWELAIEKYGNRQQISGLQRIECDEYIPTPDPLYDSAKSFFASISWLNSVESFGDLGVLLPSLRALTVLDLTIQTSSRAVEFDDIEIGCPSVSSLTLHFPSLVFPGAIDGGSLGTFMGSFNMPRLTEYSFSVELELRNVEDKPDIELDTLFQFLMASFCLDPYRHPNLAKCSIKLSHTKGKMEWPWRPQSLDIPLVSLPQNVASLTVQTSTPHIRFYSSDDQYALRELRLLECNEFDVESLAKLVASLRGIKAWDRLVNFKVENCRRLLKYEDVVKIVGEEKLDLLHVK